MMNHPGYSTASAPFAASHSQSRNPTPPSPWRLLVRQSPDKAKAIVKGKEKERKPIDPPPIIQLDNNIDPTFLHNPYLFLKVWIWHETENRQATCDREHGELLVGQTVSSLHRLKDLNNSEQGFFVFADLSVAVPGRYRLRFCLWEYSLNFSTATFCHEVMTDTSFEVTNAKDYDGNRESTLLSRAVAEQGIKLRLRKETRHPRGRASGANATVGSSSNAPIRPNPPHNGSYGTQDDSNDSMEPMPKRQRSSGADSSGHSMANTSYASTHPSAMHPSYSTQNTAYSYSNQSMAPYQSNHSYGHPYQQQATYPAGAGGSYTFPPNYSLSQQSTSSGGYSSSRAPTHPASYPSPYSQYYGNGGGGGGGGGDYTQRQ